MANLGQQFDASQVAPSTGYDVIPKGEYVMRITDSDVVQNSAQTGTILKLTLEVASGEYAGRKVFDQLNLTNPNEMAVKISRERLSAYCHATGVIQLQDSQQLHGIPFVAKVKIKVDKNGVYDDRNEISSCKKLDQGAGQPQGFGGQPQGFGGMPAQGGFQAPVQQAPVQQAPVQQGGYAQFANQPQTGFQGQAAPVGNPQVNQVVDNSPVPDMAFGGQQQGMPAQGGFQAQQPVDQGYQQQAVQQPAAAGGAKAPWEM